MFEPALPLKRWEVPKPYAGCDLLDDSGWTTLALCASRIVYAPGPGAAALRRPSWGWSG